MPATRSYIPLCVDVPGCAQIIDDLATIRSGAAAGATALQQSDVVSTYSASSTAPLNGVAVDQALGSYLTYEVLS